MEATSFYSKTDTIEHVPISHADEIALFKRFYDSEDPAESLAARDAIFTNNLRYAALAAARHSSRKQYLAELTSAANAGLLKALESRRHIPEQGRFTTFATKYIVGEICAFFRVSNAVSFPAGRLPDWPEEGTEEVDVYELHDPCAFLPQDIDHTALHEAIESLPSSERQMIELIYFGGHNVTSASKIVGVGRQWATELRNRALVKLRLALGVPQQVNEDEEVELGEAA